MSQLQAGIVRGTICAANAAERPTEEGGGLTRVVPTTWPTTMTTRAHGSMPGHRCCRMLPSLDEFHDLGLAFFCVGGEGQGR
jgi:hypothetical protein